MLTLNGIRAVPSQTFNTQIDQGIIYFQLDYRKAIEMWMLKVTFNDFVMDSIRVCNNFNLLDHYTNLIPFGIMIGVGKNFGYEPSLIDDFSSGRVTLNVLDQDELIQIDEVFRSLSE